MLIWVLCDVTLGHGDLLAQAANTDHVQFHGPLVARVFVMLVVHVATKGHADTQVWAAFKQPCCNRGHADLGDLCCYPGS